MSTITIIIKRLHAHKVLLCLLTILLLTRYPLNAQSTQPGCEQMFTRMFDAIKQVKTFRYTLSSEERNDGKYIQTSFMVKINVSPFKVYCKDLKKGAEVIWVGGQKDSDAIVSTNGFPYIDLHLDPNGKLMHSDHHQTVENLGYSYTANVLYHSLIQYSDAYAKYVHYVGDSVWEGYSCYKIEINFPDFHYYTFLVRNKGETVNSIANKFYLNNYLVLTANHLSSYEKELPVGQKVIIPTCYAKCTTLLIRKDNNLPVYLKVYNDQGLLEEYGFTKLQINPPISPAEFTVNYSGYHF